MHAYLKCYYGYKNLGDELLFFGVVDYLFNEQNKCNIDTLTVEVDNVEWFQKRLDRNKYYVGSHYQKIKLIPKQHFSWKHPGSLLGILLHTVKYWNTLKVFGGGEVFTDQRSLFHGIVNYVILYFWSFVRGNFILLGGLGTPKYILTKLLYSAFLPRAQKIVMREKTSFDLAQKYSKNVTLYNDFAHWTLEKYDSDETLTQKNYVLINLNPHIATPESFKKIQEFSLAHSNDEKYFVPCDMHDDKNFFSELKIIVPDLKLYDRTEYSIDEIFSFFKGSQGGIGARLHFLYLLKFFKRPLVPLVYQEKIKKLILDS